LTAHYPRLSALVSAVFPGDWDSIRDSGIAPRVEVLGVSDEAARQEFLTGCASLKLEKIYPQQFRTADALNSGRRSVVVMEPRRSSKTTSITAWALGRCLSRPDYRVAVVYGTTGKAARDAFTLDVKSQLDRAYPDKDSRPFSIKTGAGRERIEFDNGSVYQVCATPADFRGRTFDVVIFEEAGEFEGERWTDYVAAAQPTQDTATDPVTVITGTAGKSREGNALWDALERLRNGDPTMGGIEYSAGVDLTVEDWETWELAEPLVVASHPGVGTLTTLDTIRNNYGVMKAETFGREYLGIFTDLTGTAGILQPVKWAEAELNEPFPSSLPERAAVAFAVHPYQSCAAIVAAWRDDDGIAHLALVDHREGVRWLPERIAALATTYPSIEFGHDNRGPVLTEVETIKREHRHVLLAPQTTGNVTTAAALLVRELHTGNLRHYGQAQLTSAALSARRREIGPAFGFGRPPGDGDITALEAASLALRLYDEQPPAFDIPLMFAS